jgi:hypothetical protein
VTEEHVGGQRWRSMGRRPQQLKEAAGSVLRRFLAADSGLAADLAWLRGTRERCGVVGASALGAEERGDEGQRQTARAERSGRAFGSCHRKRRHDFSHGPTVR